MYYNVTYVDADCEKNLRDKKKADVKFGVSIPKT